jgi:hypothetical protein
MMTIRRWTIAWGLLMVAIAAAGGVLASGAMSGRVPALKGMSYTPWSSAAATSAAAGQSMRNLRQLGVDTVALNVFWFQDKVSSTAIAEDAGRFSITESAARHAIRSIKSLGMDVLLKPQVDVRDGAWRGTINPAPADRSAWFGSYGEFINTWAAIARDEGAIGLSVGTEMNAVQRHDVEWRAVVASARGRFGGWLTYSANWDAYQNVPFWDALDVVGIDAYFPLSRSDNPTAAELRHSWTRLATTIADWRSSNGFGDRPVIFSEVGYRSVHGAARRPYRFGAAGAVDLRTQADAYEALLSVMTHQPWFGGAFFWNWLPDPAAGGPLDVDYTPQNKPAEAVLAWRYGAAPGDGTRRVVV